MGRRARDLRRVGPGRDHRPNHHQRRYGYGYFWWLDPERPGSFYAFGNYGQYIYVAPDADAVIVRTGSDWGIDNHAWLDVFRDVARQLQTRSDHA
jgi:CubicO group peptidase (beta-lactamase class C family)